MDVREQWEFDTAKLPHFKLFPLSQASSWAPNIDQQLDPDTETVVLCHHGMRSMQMAGVRQQMAGVVWGVGGYYMGWLQRWWCWGSYMTRSEIVVWVVRLWQ